MLNEIARGTLANYSACTQLEEFLVGKITKNNHNIKYKCLVVIKHVARTGRPEFKKDIARNVNVIKECLQFKGPPDPLRGDEIYKRVRDLAKEVLDVLFDSNAPVATSSVMQSNRIQGIGNNNPIEDPNKDLVPAAPTSYLKSVSKAVSGMLSSGPAPETSYSNYNSEDLTANKSTYQGGGGGGAGYGGSPYGAPQPGGPPAGNPTGGSSTGIGNPNFRDARDESSSTFSNLVSKASNMASTYINSAGSGSAPTPGQNGPTLGQINYSGGGGGNPNPNPPGSATGTAGYNFASNRGIYTPSGGSTSAWQGSQSYNSSGAPPAPPVPDNAPYGSNPAQAGHIVPPIPQASGMGKAGSAASDGVYETTLISNLVQPQGMKVAIPADSPALVSFLSCAGTLSPDIVGNRLLDYLMLDTETPVPWQSRVKTLMAINYLVNAPGCEVHRDWWLYNGDNVDGIMNYNYIATLLDVTGNDSVKPLVKTQALKALQGLGVDVSAYSHLLKSDAGPAKRASVSANARGRGASPTTAAAAPAAAAAPVDLFGDDFGAPAPAPAPTAPAAVEESEGRQRVASLDLFPGLTPARKQSVDLFPGLSEEELAPAPYPPAAAQEPSAPSPNPVAAPAPVSFDVFDMIDTPTAVPVAPLGMGASPTVAPLGMGASPTGVDTSSLDMSSRSRTTSETVSGFGFLSVSDSGNQNQNQGQFNQNQGQFNQSQGQFNQNQGQFNQNQGQFNQNQGQYNQNQGQGQGQFNQNQGQGQGQFNQNQGQGQGQFNQNQGQGQGQMYPGMQVNSMTSITSQRRSIPGVGDAGGAGGGYSNSAGFTASTVVGNNPSMYGRPQPKPDSFSFVQDSMKSGGKK